MRQFPLIAAALLLCLPAAAQQKTAKPAAKTAASGPKRIGTFEDWQAATHSEAGQTVCYALTSAQNSTPAMPGRGKVFLTVTQRAGSRDAVAIIAGYAYPNGASVPVTVGDATLDFYTAQRSAFARDGHGAVGLFQKGSKVTARSPAPKAVTLTDEFSLKGFAAAYTAINKACPSK